MPETRRPRSHGAWPRVTRAFTWWPADQRLDRWLELYHQVAQRGRGRRHLLAWADLR